MTPCGAWSLGLLPAALLAWAAAADAPGTDGTAALVRRLGDNVLETRDKAYQSLLDQGADDPETVLKALPASDPNPEILARCADLRRRIPVESLRRQAMAAAGEDVSLREAAERLLDHPSHEAVTAVVLAAGEQRKREAARILISFLLIPRSPAREGPDPYKPAADWQPPTTPAPPRSPEEPGVIPVPAETIQPVRTAVVVEPVSQDPMTGEETPQIAYCALITLGDLGEKEAIPCLIRCLRDGNPGIRKISLFVLGRLGDPSTASTIARFLADDDREMRMAAAGAMAGLAGQVWPPGEAGVEAARAWWKEHEKDPAFAPPR